MKDDHQKPLAVVLAYRAGVKESRTSKVIVFELTSSPRTGVISVGLIGAGNYAVNTILPNLERLSGQFRPHAVAGNNGLKAKEAAARVSAKYATSDVDEVLRDSDIGAVIIATRHDSHASLAVRALDAGKPVFLEKPMALDESSLHDIVAAVGRSQQPFTVGFNRRFAPLLVKVREALANRTSPLIIDYQMNAGFIPYDHWTQMAVGGGRNIGEACHIYDLFCSLTNSDVQRVEAGSIGGSQGRYKKSDNFVATVTFADGSVCTLTYTSMGSRTHPKERMTVYCDEQVIELNDYRELVVAGKSVKNEKLSRQDKGHVAILRRFADGITRGERFIIPIEQLVRATEISFEVEKQLSR